MKDINNKNQNTDLLPSRYYVISCFVFFLIKIFKVLFSNVSSSKSNLFVTRITHTGSTCLFNGWNDY